MSTIAFAANTQTWWLVDNGKHLDYDGDSDYMDLIENGADTWNDHIPGVIRPDNFFRTEDVTIMDSNQTGSVVATTHHTQAKIVFYKPAMSTLSDNGRQQAATHELGHALGIAHGDDGDVMYGIVSGDTTLTDMDKASYDAAYLNY